MAIFNSYVSLPEGILDMLGGHWMLCFALPAQSLLKAATTLICEFMSWKLLWVIHPTVGTVPMSFSWFQPPSLQAGTIGCFGRFLLYFGRLCAIVFHSISAQATGHFRLLDLSRYFVRRMTEVRGTGATVRWSWDFQIFQGYYKDM